MIVRNGRDLLPACLDSVAPLIDEWIFVDTGSEDGTQTYLRQRLPAAKILETPWEYHFAQVRNLSLAQASGDWIVVLDADERLAAASLAPLATVLAVFPSAHHGYTCLREDLDTQGQVIHWTVLERVFARQPKLHYVGRIHERPCLGPQQPLHCLLRPDIRILHLSPRQPAPAKTQHYLKLLELARREEPSPLIDFYWLTLEPIRQSLPPEQRLQQLKQLLQANQAGPPPELPFPLWFSAPAQDVVLEIQQLLLASQQSQQMLADFPHWQSLAVLYAESWGLYASSLLAAQDSSGAETAFYQSLDPYYSAKDPSQGWDSWRPLQALSELYAQQGKAVASLSCALQALHTPAPADIQKSLQAQIQAELQTDPENLSRFFTDLKKTIQAAAAQADPAQVLQQACLFLPHLLDRDVLTLSVEAASQLQAQQVTALLAQLAYLLWPRDAYFQRLGQSQLPQKHENQIPAHSQRLFQALLPPQQKPTCTLFWQASTEAGLADWLMLTDQCWHTLPKLQTPFAGPSRQLQLEQLPEALNGLAPGWLLWIQIDSDLAIEATPHWLIQQIQGLCCLRASRLDHFTYQQAGLALQLLPAGPPLKHVLQGIWQQTSLQSPAPSFKVLYSD